MIVMRDGVADKPRPYVLPDEPEPVIAPAIPLDEGAPRINGPRVTGATPGRFFLHRVGATGEQPLTFSARGLPPGLVLDTRTGIISGALRGPGRAVVEIGV